MCEVKTSPVQGQIKQGVLETQHKLRCALHLTHKQLTPTIFFLFFTVWGAGNGCAKMWDSRQKTRAVHRQGES